ncbi:hypothetical protein [Nannocystis pusilla]|uniref:hypothetical protein n=1 Tax=Nannocystis pusilla TaxID=889268 RepID=UPI003BF189CC
MPSPRALLTLVLLVSACPERPKGDTETGTEPSTGPTPGTDSESSGATVGATTSGSTGTKPVPPTTTDDTATTVAPSTTTGEGTTDDSATTVDPSDTATSTTGFKIDLPAAQWPAGLVGCNLDAPAGTMVAGITELGPFTANRAYFGWWGFDDQEKPTILFASPAADPAVEVEKKDGSTSAIYFGDIVTDPLLFGGWVGDWAANLSVRANGMVTFPRPQASIDIVELAGNWDAVDPADPPRLVGSVKGPITGPFDAVFCDKLVENIFPE